MSTEDAMDVESNAHNNNNNNNSNNSNNNSNNNNNNNNNNNSNNNSNKNNNSNSNSNNNLNITSSTPNPYMDVDNHHLHPPQQQQQHQPIPQSAIDQAVADARLAVVSFLTSRHTEEIVPANSRVVLLDSTILLRHAFRALIENDVRAAPVIDLTSHQYVRLLCASDALDIILAGRGGPADTTTIGNMILQSGSNSTINNDKQIDNDQDKLKNEQSISKSNPNTKLLPNLINDTTNDPTSAQNSFSNCMSAPGLVSVKANDTLLHPCHILRNSSSTPLPPSSGKPSTTQLSLSPETQSQPLSQPQAQPASTTTTTTATATTSSTLALSPDLNPPHSTTTTTAAINDGPSNNSINNINIKTAATATTNSNSATVPSTIIPTSMVTRSIYRLTILNDRTVLCILDHGRMLRYVYTQLAPSSRLLFSLTLSQLNLPSTNSQSNFHIVHDNHKVIDVLNILRGKNLRAVPIISSNTGKLINVFSISDTALLLGADWGQSIIHGSIGDLMNRVRGEGFVVYTCKVSDCLADIFRRFEMSRKHRLFIVNDRDIVVGVLTLNDLLRYFLEGY